MSSEERQAIAALLAKRIESSYMVAQHLRLKLRSSSWTPEVARDFTAALTILIDKWLEEDLHEETRLHKEAAAPGKRQA